MRFRNYALLAFCAFWAVNSIARAVDLCPQTYYGNVPPTYWYGGGNCSLSGCPWVNFTDATSLTLGTACPTCGGACNTVPRFRPTCLPRKTWKGAEMHYHKKLKDKIKHDDPVTAGPGITVVDYWATKGKLALATGPDGDHYFRLFKFSENCGKHDPLLVGLDVEKPDSFDTFDTKSVKDERPDKFGYVLTVSVDSVDEEFHVMSKDKLTVTVATQYICAPKTCAPSRHRRTLFRRLHLFRWRCR